MPAVQPVTEYIIKHLGTSTEPRALAGSSNFRLAQFWLMTCCSDLDRTDTDEFVGGETQRGRLPGMLPAEFFSVFARNGNALEVLLDSYTER